MISGHKKAVSYVRWMDGSRLISASTDNLLKLWDINSGIASGGQHDSSPVNVLSGLSFVITTWSVLMYGDTRAMLHSYLCKRSAHQ